MKFVARIELAHARCAKHFIRARRAKQTDFCVALFLAALVRKVLTATLDTVKGRGNSFAKSNPALVLCERHIVTAQQSAAQHNRYGAVGTGLHSD